MSFAGQSQTTDTICLPIPIAQKVLVAAEQKKVLDEKIIILNERISNLQGVIKDFQGKDSITVLTYETQLKEFRLQKEILERDIKKLKRKLFWTKAAGIAGIAGAFYIGLSLK
jgi:hypothetical protein